MEYSFVTPATPQAPPAGPSAPTPTTPKTISARLKQRRVSLPSTQLRSHSALFRDEMALDEPVKNEPRDEPARTTPASVSPVDTKPVKKQRKKWTTEETQMLVDGCNEWGVGNWKAILNDPRFVFQSRSPVDLKDRFRTYFPDAYRLHYPNAKTHLSSRVRSTLPDGTSIFEKTRSKKRRPFSKEEDEALRRGYEQHGTVWATIVKDPVFQQRRSTDLRDRFRNAFPDLYQQAGYKPRPARKTQKPRTNGMYSDEPGPSVPISKSADSIDVKPKQNRLRIVTKSTPKKRGRRARKSSDDDDDSEDIDDEDVDVDDYPESEDDHPAPASNNTSPGNARGGSRMLRQHVHASRATPQPSNPNGYVDACVPLDSMGSSESEDVDMSSPIAPADIELPVTPSASFPRDLTPVSPRCLDSSAQSQDSVSVLEQPATATDDVSSIMSSHGLDSLIYPSGEADSTWLTTTAVTSPTSSEYFLHPHHVRREDCMNRIGKSAWATSDWLSANPRLDGALSDALAFSHWSTTTTNSVVDRYNLYTSTAGVAAHEFSSEAGDHQHYDEFGFRESNPISYYAGDLFPGSGMVNTSVHAHMGPGGASGTGSVDEQGVECLSLESVVQPHMLQAGLGRLSLAEANATGDLSDGVSIDKSAPADSNQLDAPNTIPYMLPMPSSLSNLSMAGVQALSAPTRPTHARRSHSLFDFSGMDALDLQRPGYPVSFDVDATAPGMFADALDLAALGLEISTAPAAAAPQAKDIVPNVRMQNNSAAISPSDLLIRKTDSAEDKMRKRTSWRV
ncbi:unnamed protein product [Rhizoctonia solani]|uniref:Meiotically up-regulated gene 152 protein n=2 Tax=Rhizoctonia solani TaxID=456999 RepID=A0A8H2WR15_9AGAM|nr:hypothetical protein V565_097840 [Rhizoctonia solani 123E]CAE6397111.1 unnamed protein product [Rhizoctonia solani]